MKILFLALLTTISFNANARPTIVLDDLTNSFGVSRSEFTTLYASALEQGARVSPEDYIATQTVAVLYYFTDGRMETLDGPSSSLALHNLLTTPLTTEDKINRPVILASVNAAFAKVLGECSVFCFSIPLKAFSSAMNLADSDLAKKDFNGTRKELKRILKTH